MKMTKNTISALLALLMAPGLVSAGSLEELEALAAASPEEHARVFDNAARASGAPSDRAMTQQQLRQTLLADLDSIKNIFESRYAPAGWKGEVNGWSLDAEIQKAKAEVNAMGSVSVTEYRKIVKRLFASTQDYHVSVNFYSTEVAVLPLAITESGGRYYISAINRKKLPETVFPFKAGDEVISFDGKTMDEAIADYLREAGMNNVPGNDRAQAASLLRVRAGELANDMPSGPALLGIKPAGATSAATVKVDWSYTPELIPPQPFVNKGAGDRFPLDWMTVMYSDLLPYAGAEAAGFSMGDKEGYLPDLGEKIWSAPASSPFRAYIYRNPADGRNTGYVRIPTFLVPDPVKNAAEFAKIVAELERGADALVIDQLNNPGGSVPYMYAIASMMTASPLQVPLHRITLTPADVSQAIEFAGEAMSVKTEEDAVKLWGAESWDGYPVTLEFINNFRDANLALVEQWKAGKTLTDPLPLKGISRITPAYGPRFTKPIMILTNELDISCGDFFPAIMQDNRRAVTFGARTSGAGGAVKRYKYQNSLLGMNEFGLTETIAIRPDGRPIETLGVTPDLPYQVQPGDLQNGFKAYAAAVNQAVTGLKH